MNASEREPAARSATHAAQPAAWSAALPPAARASDFPRVLLDVEAHAVLRSMPGRETFLWPVPDGLAGALPLVVKRFTGERRGVGLRALFTRARMSAMSAGQREHENLLALAEAGVPVPRALAWCARRDTSLVAMECVVHAETLRERLVRDPASAADLGRELVELVARLHASGWYHRDLYLGHVVCARRGSDAEQLVLLDVGRARRAQRRRAPRRRWWIKDLAALLYSTPSTVGVRARVRFLCRYLDLRGVHGRARRRRWLRAIVAKAARIAAHEPRFSSPAVPLARYVALDGTPVRSEAPAREGSE